MSSGKSFLKGAAILAMAGIVAHIIGAIYRIPLVYIIGKEGVGLYQMAYPVYALLLTLSTTGIIGAISKLVSERLVHGDEAGARRVFRVSLAMLSVVGLVSAAAMAFGSDIIAGWVAGESGSLAQPSMLAASPALLFVAVITPYRGYFQGRQHMVPTAMSQLLEQVVKIVPGFFIASWLNRYGVQYGAAGAMWGVALSEVVALAYLMITYARKRKRQSWGAPSLPEAQADATQSAGKIAGRLAALALPMMAGAIFLPLASLSDAFIVMNRLTELGGSIWSHPESVRAYYGILSGMVHPIANVPSVLSLALSTSLIPAVAESKECGDWHSVERRCRVGLKTTMLVALPSMVGLAVLAKPILNLLYGSSLDPVQLDAGSWMLVTSSMSVVFLSVVQSTNGMLQGLGRVYVPIVSLGAGVLAKIILTYILVGIPSVNIIGAPLGTIACYLIPTVINLAVISKSTGMRLRGGGMLIRPALAAAGMGAVVWALVTMLPGAGLHKWIVVLAVLVAVPVYLGLAALFGAIGREELSYIPKGDRIVSFLSRKNWLSG